MGGAKVYDAMAYYEPSPRSLPFAAPVEGELYLYGGRTDDFNERPESSTDLEIFDPKLETWRSVKTKGHPPPLLYDGACASSDHHLYICCGFDNSSHHNSLYQLDTRTLTWTELSSSDRSGPRKKIGCSMVCYKQKLVLFGGECDTTGPTQTGASYEARFTNELHTFDLNEGTWSSPTISGTRPLPCSGFSFTMVDDHHAVLFGGWVPGQAVTNDVYILDLERMHWRKLVIQEGSPYPERRSSHTAVCLGYATAHPQLLVIGGYGGGILNDAWMLDLHSEKWRKMSLPEDHQEKRWGHCSAAFTMCPGLTEVVLFGGMETYSRRRISRTSVLQFEYQESVSTDEWVLTDVAGMSQLGTRERITEKNAKITCRLAATPMTQQSIRREGRTEELEQRIREMERRMREVEEGARDAEERANMAERRLGESERRAGEAERRLQERVNVAERRAGAAERRSQESERRVNEAERRAGEAERRLGESERRAEEAERRFQQLRERAAQFEDRLHQLETQWVVRREEIQLTGPELGRGGWATVSVATFRGMQVAAKSIHRQIISQHNERLFKREMNMAARIRHPNLVQFVGATLEGEMIILTELMPTSLRRELESNDYMAPIVVSSIGLGVSRALNYLHQMQPDPIIHRDISSANVLLEPITFNKWRAKVTDYGSVNLQQQLETEGPGNPTYAAPEANHPRLQSPKMDIFSFGILLIEMLTGELPPSDKRHLLMGTIRHRRLLALIERCLNQQRENRPSASDIISELEH